MDGKTQNEYLQSTYKAINKLWSYMREFLSASTVDWQAAVNQCKGDTEFEKHLMIAGIREIERIQKCLNESQY